MLNDRARWLARLIETSGLSHKELEARLGWSPGSLGQLLDGSVECEPHHLVSVLSGIGSEPGRPAYQDQDWWQDSGTQMVEDLIERFRRLGYSSADSPLPVETLNGAELEKRVESVLRGAFGPSLKSTKKAGG